MEKIVVPFDVARLYWYSNDDFYEHLKKLSSSNLNSKQDNLELNNLILEEDFLVYFNEQLLWVCNEEPIGNETKKINKFHDCLKKFDITTKEFISFLFEKDFSDNLIEMFIEGESVYDYFDKQEFYGSHLNLSKEFEQVIENKEVSILDVKMQPRNNDISITLRDENIVEFSFEAEKEEQLNTLYILSNHILDFLRNNSKDDVK